MLASGTWAGALCLGEVMSTVALTFLKCFLLFSSSVRTPEANSRASSPCQEFEQFQIIPTVETPYLARAGKNEFLNLVPDIEEVRAG